MRNRRIRVLEIVDRLDEGGAERIVVDIARRLDPERFAVEICTTREPGRFAPEVEALGMPVFCLDRHARYDLNGFAKLVRLLARERPDVVHTHKVGSNTIGRLAALWTRTPVIIAHEHTSPERSLGQQWFDQFLVRGTFRVIACDTALRRSLIAVEHLPPERIAVIHNGVELERIAMFHEAPDALRRRLGLDSGLLVGTLARLAPQKDIPNLLQAVPKVLRRVPDVNFVIVGDGPLRQDLEVQAATLGIGERVKFMGFRSDTRDLLAALDVFVLSSIWEGLPVAVLEAMALGKPVVATDVGGVADAVVSGRTGLLVPPQSPDALAQAIYALLTDRSQALEYGALGRQRVLTRFTIGRMVRELEALYLSGLEETRRAQCAVHSARCEA